MAGTVSSGQRAVSVEPRNFIYDGWNPIKSTAVRVNADSESAVSYATYDANGNVSEYIDAVSGNVAGHYEYDAFGNLTKETGDNAGDFPHRFSTKYLDGQTTLYYYGHRFYSPELGRWLSRDPIGEEGGENCCAMLENDVLSKADILGLKCTTYILVGHGRAENQQGITDDIDKLMEGIETLEESDRIGAVSCHMGSTNQRLERKYGALARIPGVPRQGDYLWSITETEFDATIKRMVDEKKESDGEFRLTGIPEYRTLTFLAGPQRGREVRRDRLLGVVYQTVLDMAKREAVQQCERNCCKDTQEGIVTIDVICSAPLVALMNDVGLGRECSRRYIYNCKQKVFRIEVKQGKTSTR